MGAVLAGRPFFGEDGKMIKAVLLRRYMWKLTY